MRERRSIVQAWNQGEAEALVTLTRVEGSSYRQPGARMLVTRTGSIGSISGGCLEAEVARKARWASRTGAVLDRFSTVIDDVGEMPYGLGCGGTLDLLIEPTDTPEADALAQAMRDSLNGQRRNVITWLPVDGKPLGRTVFDESGVPLFDTPGPHANSTAFEEWLDPPQRLFIFGAGEDARPVTAMAALLGWSAIVIDGRAQLARRERFPAADLVIASSTLQQPPGPKDAVILMSHSYDQDLAWLTAVLPHRPRYLGLLGSRHRSALLVSEAAQALGWDLDRACHNLFAPVGLDLGGDGPEPIALAIVAEVQACCEGKLGHSRRMTPQMIAEQIASGGPAVYLKSQCAL